MTEMSVRALAEDDWRVLRQIRLDALRESPDAFVAGHDAEAARDEDFWRTRMREVRTFLAERDGEAVALVGLGMHGDDPENGEVVGLWVRPQDRRGRVARTLIGAAVKHAHADGRKRLYFWVNSDNGPAVAFASIVGFRPTSERRVVPGAGDGEEQREIAMVMSLSSDPRSVANPWMP